MNWDWGVGTQNSSPYKRFPENRIGRDPVEAINVTRSFGQRVPGQGAMEQHPKEPTGSMCIYWVPAALIYP